MLDNVQEREGIGMGEAVLEYVSPHDLKFAPFQPQSRTEKKALSKLRAAIDSAGRILVPLLVTGNNEVADGHRRLSIALELGFETVPIMRYDMGLADMWSNANSGTLAPKSPTWGQAVRNGLPLSNVPDRERYQISELIRVVGKKTFNKLMDVGRSPYIFVMAKSVARYCGEENDKFIKLTINWFEDCQQQFAVRRALADKCPPDVLIAAIKDNRPIRQYWGVVA